jgi:signal transduction histidine kinase
MRRWPLKLKVGIYSAALVVVALIGTALLMFPYIYRTQLAELDERLADDAEELFRDLENSPGAPVDPQKPVNARFIPVALRLRYIDLEGPNGEELYTSPNLRGSDLRRVPPGLHTIELFGRNCRVGTFRKGPFTLHVGTRLGTIEGMQEDLRQGFYFALPIVAIGVFLGGLWLAARALRPVAAMTAAAERIGAQTPDERLPSPTAGDELARLTVVLNESFDRLQRAYKSAARFSADASHQLKTPISVLRAGIDELRRDLTLTDEQREVADLLLQQTRRLTTIVEDLLLLAQADAGRLKMETAPLDLTPILATMHDDLETLGAEKDVRVESQLPERLIATADPRRVEIILQNLGDNALKYNWPGGGIRLSTRSENGSVFVSIANTGQPIPARERERLFERFHRAGQSESIRGSGLGLNIARELARAHGGDLRLTRSDGEWTEFELRLPAAGTQNAE